MLAFANRLSDFSKITLVGAISVCLAVLPACQRDRDPANSIHVSKDKDVNSPLPKTLATSGDSAEALFLKRDYDSAARQVQRELIAMPSDPGLTLLAAKIEAARGNTQLALDITESLTAHPTLAKEVSILRYSQSQLLDNEDEAQRSLERLCRDEPNNLQWFQELWQLLNRRGMRHEASALADTLCQAGAANDQQMFSLIRRTDSFPATLRAQQRPEELFSSGLGLARWYFTQGQYPQAISELKEQQILTAEFMQRSDAKAALALYGRLLAESQLYEQMPSWHAACDETVRIYGDYWAAMGSFLIDQGKSEAAARALLEAVYQNPTDRVCFQRLGRVLDALGRADDAISFRAAGILISETESLEKILRNHPSDPERRNAMAQKLMQLYRPFESLQWAQSRLAPNDLRTKTMMQQQRQKLQSHPLAKTMASQAALMELDRDAFQLGDAIETAFGALAAVSERVSAAQALAIPRLVNVAPQAGLDFQWYADTDLTLDSIAIYQSIGGGVAVLDYDRDGWPDVYCAQGSGKPPQGRSTRSNQLFRNLAGKFVDVTTGASADDWNYSSGQAAGDVNQDGFADIFVGNLGPNRLLINQGDGTFRDATKSLGNHADAFTTSLAIADLDGDALPDLFECNYIEMEGGFTRPRIGPDGLEVQTSPLEHFAQSDRWFRNQGDATFTEKTIDSAIAQPGTSLGVLVADFDGDGANEVFVGNDERPNHFLKCQPDGQFRNFADLLGCAYGFSGAATGCMGIAAGDFNRDGRLDVHVTNFLDEPANLYLQSPHGGFQDAAKRFRIDIASQPYVGFGTKAVDLDRNGWLDLAVTNGHIFDMRRFDLPFKMPPQLLISQGNQFELAPVQDPSGYWQKNYLGRSMNLIDFDRDGALDLIIGHLDAPLALLHNETTSSGSWLQFELVGVHSERDAIGAKITVLTDRGEWRQWVSAGDGYLSSDERVVDFGLDDAKAVLSVQIDWPSGGRQRFAGPLLGRRYLAIENSSQLTMQKNSAH